MSISPPSLTPSTWDSLSQQIAYWEKSSVMTEEEWVAERLFISPTGVASALKKEIALMLPYFYPTGLPEFEIEAYRKIVENLDKVSRLFESEYYSYQAKRWFAFNGFSHLSPFSLWGMSHLRAPDLHELVNNLGESYYPSATQLVSAGLKNSAWDSSSLNFFICNLMERGSYQEIKDLFDRLSPDNISELSIFKLFQDDNSYIFDVYSTQEEEETLLLQLILKFRPEYVDLPKTWAIAMFNSDYSRDDSEESEHG
jgi:hypothetical protein